MNACPYKLMTHGKPVQEVLKATLCLPKEHLKEAASALSDEFFVECAVYVTSTCHALGVRRRSWTGGLLQLFCLATQSTDRKEFFAELCDDLGLSASQAERCLSEWQRFACEESAPVHRQFRLAV